MTPLLSIIQANCNLGKRVINLTLFLLFLFILY
nr:MAG TPA: hypothetical protein [Caudoviricetes sp.]